MWIKKLFSIDCNKLFFSQECYLNSELGKVPVFWTHFPIAMTTKGGEYFAAIIFKPSYPIGIEKVSGIHYFAAKMYIEPLSTPVKEKENGRGCLNILNHEFNIL